MTTLDETMNSETFPLHYMGDGKITCKAAMESMMCDLHHKGVREDLEKAKAAMESMMCDLHHKGVREDLEKAKACIDYLLEYLPGDEDS